MSTEITHLNQPQHSSELKFPDFKYNSDAEIRSIIQHKYSKQFDLNLIFSGLSAILLPIYNIFAIYQNFFIFYSSYNDIYNLIVASSEFFIINLILLGGIVQFSCPFNYSVGKRLFFFDRFLASLQFNLFSLVHLTSFNNLLSLFSNARHHGELEVDYFVKKKEKFAIAGSLIYYTMEFFITIFYLTFYAFILILITFSVLTKLYFVSFVGVVQIDQWSFHQWILFLGILNNLASISNGDAVCLRFMWTILNDEWNKVNGKWKTAKVYSYRMCQLYEIMFEQNRWKTLLWVPTMNGRELHDLVRKP